MAGPAQQQAQAYTAEGAPIAPEDTAKAVREGRGFFQKNAKVYARNPEGQLVTVSPADAALPAYQVLSPSELTEARLKRDAESGAGLVKTGAEGVVRGGTAGLLGPEQFYDSEGRKNAAARVKYNPNLAAGSEVAGMLGSAVATSLLTGGGGAPMAAEGITARLAGLGARGALTPFRAAAALGEAAEGGAAALGAGKGIIGTGLRLGARGAAEGAVFGAGHEVSQAALEDVPLTAERLLAGAWDGAKMGGAFGAGLGVVGAGVGKAGRAIMGRVAESGDDIAKATGTWAENATFKQAVGNNGKIYDQATNFGTDMARPARIGRKLLDADMPVAPRAALKRAGELTDDAFKRMETVVQTVDDAGVMANPESVLRVVDDQISKIREVPFGDAQAVADRIERNIAPFRERFGPKVVPRETEDIFGRAGYGGPPGPATLAPPEQIKLSQLWELRKELDKSINFETRAGGPAKDALMDMRSAFRSELDDTIARAAETSGGDPGLLKAWKQAAEDYGDMALIKKSLKQVINREAKNRSISASDYGSGGAAGILMGILSGNPVVGLATSAVTSGVHKLIRERGLGVMAKIADRSGLVASRMDAVGAVAALTDKAAKVATPVAINVGQQFDHYSKLLQEAKADPAVFAERMGHATADLMIRTPELAQKIQQTMLEDLAYLDQLHPTPSTRFSSSLTPAALKAPVYAFDQQKAFVDAAMALDNPVGVFESLAHGDFPMAGLNALKVRRPLLFGEMRQVVIKHTMTRTTELPFYRRNLLGVAFEFPADWSLANIGAIQESLVAGDVTSKHDPRAAPSKVNTDPGAEIAPVGF